MLQSMCEVAGGRVTTRDTAPPGTVRYAFSFRKPVTTPNTGLATRKTAAQRQAARRL